MIVAPCFDAKQSACPQPFACTIPLPTKSLGTRLHSNILCFVLIGSKVHMLASTVSSKFLGALAEVEGFQFEVSTPMHSSASNTLCKQ